MKSFFKLTVLAYLIYLIEFCLLSILVFFLFKIEHSNVNISNRIANLFKESFVWTIVFRTIYGYSLFFILLLFFFKKRQQLNTLSISLIGMASYLFLSLLYAFVFIPNTKEFLEFKFSYNNGYFYYSMIIIFITPFLLSKIGVLKKLI